MMNERENEAYLDRGRPSMSLSRWEHENLLIFDLAGDFDTTSAGPAKEEIRGAIEGGHIRILLNLEDVHYIDSAGLGTLVSVLKAARGSGGNVMLAGLAPQVKMVIELTRLQRIFEIFDSVEAALEELTEVGTPETTE